MTSKRKPAAALKAAEPARKDALMTRAYYRKRKPVALDVLGKLSGIERWSDENIKLLHLYLYANLSHSDREMRRRGLGNGEEVYVQVVKPYLWK